MTAQAAAGQIALQPPLVDPFVADEVAVVRIEIGDAVTALLHPDSVWSDFLHPGTFIYERGGVVDTVENVGVRLRGNTSRMAAKKSFKVDFDAWEPGREWMGLACLNLNGQHNDVSVIRARMVHEMMREAGIPVSRTSHVRVYLNGEYRGLYLNTEHIDGPWLEKRFPDAHGNLWKCTYPANLQYQGPDGDDYKFTPSWSSTRVYDLKTNNLSDDYSGLAHFIDVLNNTPLADLPCALEAVFDVDAYLRVAAAEILVGHWDNYIGNQNNFYLYERSTDGRLMYLPYDMDNTLGVQWFGNWANQNPYAWSLEPGRPLYHRLMQVPGYRARFTEHLAELLATGFEGEVWEERGEDLLELVGPAAEEDIYRTMDYGFSWSDFQASVGQTWGSHIALGIVPYVQQRRTTALAALEAFAPAAGHLMGWASGPVADGVLRVEARVEPEDAAAGVWGEVASPEGTVFTVPLQPSGEAPGHWHGTLDVGGWEYAEVRVVAQWNGGSEAVSPCVGQRVWTSPHPGPLRINEVMPANNSFVADADGGYDDWVELAHIGGGAVSLANWHLTDRRLEPGRFPLPALSLDPGDHLVLWCDDAPEEGPLHTNFQLDAAGDDLWLMRKYNGAWRWMDRVEWSAPVPPNASWARIPDGTGPWTLCTPFSSPPPTPGSPNDPASVDIGGAVTPQATAPLPYPNPAASGTSIRLPAAGPYRLTLPLGQTTLLPAATGIWETAGWPAGVYVIQPLSQLGVHWRVILTAP
jgi:hypothetical protein